MATATTRIKADPHPQPVPMTQHQMVNIGIGNQPDAPLKYVAELWLPDMNLICTRKAKLYATSEEHAEKIIHASYPKAIIDSLRIL
jgi:hypothetical protein